ncbi:MAG: TetR family transcriptional regulator [Actinobacteria bacterium]|nr:MAG: TetR family transcriptional regulator [Actinomycetota bacterium]
MYMRTRRMSRAESKARTREQLLDSAESVFARRGYTAATIEEISEGAGFSRGAFYANFADKSEVFLAIAEAGQQQAFAEIAARIDATEAEGILDMMYEWFTRVLVHGRLRRALDEFRLVAIDDPSLRKRLASFERAATDLTAQVLADFCHAHGVELTVSTEAFAGMVTALVGGYATRLALDPRAVEPEEIGQALEALWSGLVRAS